MVFPYYSKYIQMITTRDHVVLAITLCTIFICTIVLLVRRFQPTLFRLAAWLLGVGGFYATLGYWAYYCFTHP